MASIEPAVGSMEKVGSPPGRPTGTGPGGRITRDDIEAKFRELQGETDVIGDEVRSYAILGGAAVVGGLLMVAFVLGRRRGRRNRTVVEIRRA